MGATNIIREITPDWQGKYVSGIVNDGWDRVFGIQL